MTNTTNATKTATKTTDNGWEKIAKKNLKNAYNWLVGEREIARDDGDMTEEQFYNWMTTEALDEIYHEAITTLYTGDSTGEEAPKEMRFAGKEFCYKYLVSLFKKDGYTVTTPEAEPKTKKTATKTKKTTKKAVKTEAKVETFQVILRAFTGMKIGTYTATLDKGTIKFTAKNGKEMEFNLDGTQKVDCKNPKFNNRIEIVAEA